MARNIARRASGWLPEARGVGARVAAIALIALGLGGCYDTEYKVSIKPDGTAAIDIGFRFDKEMEDVFAMVEAFGDVAPEAAILKGGLCNALEQLGKSNPAAAGYNVRGTQGRVGDQFNCALGADAGPVAQLAQLASADPTGAIQLKEVGPRKYLVQIDLGALPAIDTAELIKMGMMMQGDALKTPGGQPIKPEVISKVADQYVLALMALSKILMRGKTVDLVFAGKTVAQTNGKVDADGKSVRFRMSMDEFTAMTMKGAARQGKKFTAVVEY